LKERYFLKLITKRLSIKKQDSSFGIGIRTLNLKAITILQLSAKNITTTYWKPF
jgi:hypothetical protein